MIFNAKGSALDAPGPFDPSVLDGIDFVLVDPRCPAWAEAALREARRRGIPSMLDGELSPRADLQRLVPLADWRVFSERGLLAYADGEPEALLRQLASSEPTRHVVRTLGAQGVQWCDAQVRLCHLPAVQAGPVIDTLGAGDVFHAALALALVLAAVLGPGFHTVVLVIVVTYWTWYARIVRGEVMSLKQRDYVALARVAGCGTLTIFRRHLLPNLLNTLLVLATLQVGQVIIFEASLSFLGLGIQQPDVSWGLMLADARNYITNAWWAITMPGLAIMATCLASNLLGDWLRDHFDPKRRQL